MAQHSGTDKNSLGEALKAEVLTPGEKFGDYQVFQCLNFGFLGGLYVMQHIREFTETCVHVIPKLAQEDPRFNERLQTITGILKELDHPNVMRFRELGTIKGRTCLFFDPVQGVNLSEYLENFVKEKQQRAAAGGTPLVISKPADDDGDAEQEHAFGLPASVVRDAVRQATEGLRAAHEKRIRHLNLIPTNLILTSDGVVKVSGLGLFDIVGKEYFERLVSAGISPVRVGPRKFFVNAVDSLSPEMRQGLPGDVRSDLYGLGVSTYYLLTGHRPGANPPPPSSYSATIPDGWDKITEKCLERDLEKRYSTPAAIISDLDRLEKITASVAQGESSLSKQLERIPLPKSVSRRFKPKTIRLIRLGVLGAFALIVVNIAATSYAVLFTDDTPSQQPAVSPIQRAGAGERAHLALSLQPERVNVRITGRHSARFPIQNGQLRLRMPAGEYQLSLDSTGYVSLNIPLEITQEELTVDLRLERVYGQFSVRSVPGATVAAITADGEVISLGETSPDGELVVNRKLGLGTYAIAIERDNYAPALVPDIEVKEGDPTVVEQFLEPFSGELTIISEPAGATVRIGGEVRGVTPLTVEDFPVLEDVDIVVEQQGFQGIRRTVRLDAGEQRTLNMGDLAAQMGIVTTNIRLNGRQPDEREVQNLEISLGGQLLASSQKEFAVPVGPQPVRISHPDYLPETKNVRVLDGQVTQLTADLKPRPARVYFDVQSDVPYAVNVNGRTVTVTDDRISLSPGEDHQVEISAPDHLLLRRTVNLGPNRELRWEAELTRIPGPERGKDYTVPYVGLELKAVPQGSFSMGSPLPEQDRRPAEGPATTVRFSRPFWVGASEVTQAQYIRLMERNPSYFREESALHNPVEQVSWEDAMDYCRRLTEQERRGGRLPAGYVYRLPTEAEWEYFARAGTQTPFTWGDTATPEMGNFVGVYPRDLSRAPAAGRSRTVRVASFEANKWGLYDIHGNVREWCLDSFASRYPGGTVTDHVVLQGSEDKVVRGGSWEDVAHRTRVAARERYHPGTVLSTIGFRVVLAPANAATDY